jgi:hypothetical protein
MTDINYFPPSLQTPEAKDEVIAWVKQLPLPLEAKKSLLSHWSKFTNTQLTLDDWQHALVNLESLPS